MADLNEQRIENLATLQESAVTRYENDYEQLENLPKLNGETIIGDMVVAPEVIEIWSENSKATHTGAEFIALLSRKKYVFTYKGQTVFLVKDSNGTDFKFAIFEDVGSQQTPRLARYYVDYNKNIIHEQYAVGKDDNVYLPYSVNNKNFRESGEITLKAGDIRAEINWTPAQDDQLATKKYVDDNAGGTPDWSDIQNKPNFATVATSGDYDDLLNKPTIPAAQEQADWNEADNTKVDYIKNKPTIPTAGTITSGSTGYATGGDVYTALQGVSGWVASATAPLDTSVLWIDTDDNTVEGLADADNSEY